VGDARARDRVWQDFEMVQRAAAYAAEAHRDDLRKGTTIPYVSHLWSVAALVLEHGGDDRQVAAAFLHDVVEDHGGLDRLADVRARFGGEIASMVEALSDSTADTDHGEEKRPWRERKEAYLARLAGEHDRVLLVSACDKLHNARSILSDLRLHGDATWNRFTQAEAGQQLWYLRSLVDALAPRVPPALGTELRRTVAAVDELANGGR
jgi:(p)ppGpp synthase/HD superfamily hydrolase